jgi:hypothetical protein
MVSGQVSARRLATSVFAVVLATLGLLAYAKSQRHWSWFFRADDPVFFRAIARSPFGDGRAFVAMHRSFEASYRYGRIGYPLFGWLGALGRPGLAGPSLAVLNIVAISATPALAILLMDRYGGPPIFGVSVLLAPGLLIMFQYAYSEPTAIALILAGFLLAASNRRGAAIAIFAAAILVREVAVLALVPFFWDAWKRRDVKSARAWLVALVPYVVWTVVVRIRVGEFPFLANDPSRKNALSFPFVGMYDALRDHQSSAAFVALLLIATAAFGVAAAWWARRLPIAGAAATMSLFALCTGPNTIQYAGDTLRILVLPHVLAILCCAYAVSVRSSETGTRSEIAH